jgi:3-oxoacyl-[acyl-carrier-protein] synthase II
VGVVVTGLGVVSSFGCGVEPLWRGCLAGDSVVSAIPPEWQHYYAARSQCWSPLPAIDYPSHGFSRAENLTLSEPVRLAIIAADEAIRQAGGAGESPAVRGAPSLCVASPGGLRTGAFVGTGFGGAAAPFDNYRAHLLAGLKRQLERLAADDPSDPVVQEHLSALSRHPRVNPLVICQSMPNSISASLGIRYGLTGPNDTACYACTSGTTAIGRAYAAIASGELDFAIAGGVEHLRDNAGGVFMGFDRLQTLAKPHLGLGTENRPFDRERSGFLFSEGGAAFLVLESRTHAQARGATALAEVVGFAATSDARSLVALDLESNTIAPMFERALASAGVDASAIGYINAHGTGTELNDPIEAALLQRCFGSRPYVNSTKSILGHTIGASGALEAVVTVLSLARQTVHVSRNLDTPVADLNFCTATTEASFDYAVTHSFGFGGHNAALVFRRSD